MTLDEVMSELRAAGTDDGKVGMAHFGIKADNVLGVSVVTVRRIGREIKRKDHALAGQLWETGVHEARILASIVEEPSAVTGEQMDAWVRDFDSWDICDQCCGNLFWKTPYAWDKAVEWSEREREFEKRASFALMAYLAVHAKKAPDEKFLPFFQIIKREAGDTRNFVKKAVNWALRQIGKRNPALRVLVIETAREILAEGGKGKWVASDALRELTSQKPETSDTE